jgi:hypothetical protein
MAIKLLLWLVAQTFNVNPKLVDGRGAKFRSWAKIPDIGLINALPIQENDVLQAVHKDGNRLKTTAVQVIVSSSSYIEGAFLHSGCSAKKNADSYFHRYVAQISAIKYE